MRFSLSGNRKNSGFPVRFVYIDLRCSTVLVVGSEALQMFFGRTPVISLTEMNCTFIAIQLKKEVFP